MRSLVVAALLTLPLTACSDAVPEGASSSSVVTTPSAESSSDGSRASSVTPTVDPYPAPYVDHVEWVETAVGRSLQIHPTPNGRRTTVDAGASDAWAEVLALDPSADSPGMRDQFDCHWDFARAVAPDKPSWNLEPDRPVVPHDVMIQTRCNPGAPEE